MKDTSLRLHAERPKRAAICFSGQARMCPISSQSLIRHVIIPLQEAGYSINVFMHFWDTVTQGGHVSKFLRTYTGGNPSAHKQIDDMRDQYPSNLSEAQLEIHQDAFSFFMETFPPNGAKFEASLKEEDFILKKLRPPPGEITPWAYNSQYHSVRASHDICRSFEDKEGFRYDLVLRVRTDHTFLDPLPLDEISPDFLCVPNTTGHGNTLTYEEVMERLSIPELKDAAVEFCRDEGMTLDEWVAIQTQLHYFDATRLCNDQFAISSSENMFQYSRLIEFIHKSIEDPTSQFYEEMVGPQGIPIERMLFLHVQEFAKIQTFSMRNRLNPLLLPLEGQTNNVMAKYLEQRENT